MEFLRRLFGDRSKSAANEAKRRLISVLIHDRTDISPQLLENLRVEMVALLKKYMEIDESNIELSLDHDSPAVALIANIPVLKIKRGSVNLSEMEASEEGGVTRSEPARNHNKNRRRK